MQLRLRLGLELRLGLGCELLIAHGKLRLADLGWKGKACWQQLGSWGWPSLGLQTGWGLGWAWRGEAGWSQLAAGGRRLAAG